MTRPSRRVLVLVLAAMVVIGAAIGTLAVTAMNSTAANATATPTATADPTPSASLEPTATPAPTPVPTATPSPTAPPPPRVNEYFVAKATEPGTAADPFHPGVVAVVSENLSVKSGKYPCSRPIVRMSKDGGATWTVTPANPWGTYCEDIHAVIAWGPNSRLWAGDAVGAGKGVLMSVTYSDDLGKTWAKPFVEHFTPLWIGCYPAITVDNSPASPNFGTVYVAYNWLRDKYGPGVHVMASKDGAKWVDTEVPATSGLAKYPYSWRIGYRVKTAPDGTVFVSFYQSSLKTWSTTNIFEEGSGSNIGRLGYEVGTVHFDGLKLTADVPVWGTTVSHIGAQWQSGLAVDDSGKAWLAVDTKGRIRLGQAGGTWKDFSISGKTSTKPSLAISGRTIFLGWHARDNMGRVWRYYTFSFDGGKTFLTPALVNNKYWWAQNGSNTVQLNGVGLRENAEFVNGVVYWAYGDARSGLAVYMAQIKP